MFSTTTPEKPAWIIAALSIIGGVVLVATHHAVPTILQGIALAGLVAAVALADAGTANIFAWGLVILALTGLIVLALLSDGLPTWLEAVAGLGVTGGASLAVPVSVPLVIHPGGTTTLANSGPVATAHPSHFVGPR